MVNIRTLQPNEGDDEGDDDASLATSVSSMSFDEKLAEIKHGQMHEWSTRRVSNIAQTGARLVGRSVVSAAKDVSERHLVPEFLAKKRRERATRQALSQIEADERKRLHDRDVARAAAREKREQMQLSRAETMRRIEHSAATVEQLHTLKGDHEATARESRIDNYLTRRAQEEEGRAEVQKAEEEEQEALLDAEERTRRKEALAYWTDTAREYRREANDLSKAKSESTETDPAGRDEVKELHQRMSKAVSASIREGGVEGGKGVSLPPYSSRSVFRSSYPQKNQSGEGPDNDIVRVTTVEKDQLPLFSRAHRSEGEEMRAAIMERDMRRAKQENYISTIEKQVQDCVEQINRQSTLKQNLEFEKVRIDVEINDLLQRQPKPIRIHRDPSAAEKLKMHKKKERSAEIQSESNKVDDSIVNLHQTTAKLNAKLHEVTAKKSHNPCERRGEANVADMETAESSDLLPMVVGRRLGKAFDPFIAEPSTTHDIILQQSRTAILRAQVEEALERHRCNSIKGGDIGKANKKHQRDNVYLDYLESTAAQVAQRLETETRQNHRQLINEAVKRFWRAGCVLKKVSASASEACGYCIDSKEQLGDRRMTNLLSELIAASDSNDEYWDSRVLLGSHARYRRTAFIRQLQAEISRLNVQCSASKEAPRVPKTDREARLHASNDRYMQRRRGLLSEAMPDLENCQMQALDNGDSRDRLIGQNDDNMQSILRIPNFSRAVSSIEKERCELNRIQDRFYDFEVTEGVHKINLLHGANLRRASPAGDDDFRTLDLKRRAAFHDVLDTISRVRGFKMRLCELGIKRSTLVQEQSEVLKSLSSRREEMVGEGLLLKAVENDFFEAVHRIEYAAIMRQSHANAASQLGKSEVERHKASGALAEAREAASNAESDRSTLLVHVKSIWGQKLQVEAVMPDLRERADLTKELVLHCTQAMERAEDTVTALQFRCRGRYVPTRFGPKRVLFFREKDSMLCVSLQFGKQLGGGTLLQAKMYAPLAECIERDKTATKMELDLMQQEERERREYLRLEAIIAKKESFAMTSEDRALNYEKVQSIELHKKASLKMSFKDLRKPSMRLQLKRRMSDAFRLADRTEGADREGSMHGNRSMVAKHERLDFVRDRAAVEQKPSIDDSDQATERDKRVCMEVSTLLSLDVAEELIHELCADTLATEMSSKEEAMIDKRICSLWSLRKGQLKEKVKGTTFADYAEGVRTIEQLKHAIVRRKQEEVDEAKRLFEQRQMSREDSETEQLHRHELNSALTERRNMIAEEHYMKIFFKQEKMEQERKKRNTTYGLPVAEVSVKVKRRTELKRGAAERQRIQKEVERMKAEDDLSEKARREYRKKEQLKMLQMELDGELQSLVGGGSIGMYGSSSGDDAATGRNEAEYQDAILACAASELDWMERQEEANTFVKELRRNERKLDALEKDFKECFLQEIAATTRQRATQIHLKACTEETLMASEGQQSCCQRLAEKEKELIRAELKEKCMDTAALTSFQQRWSTVQLRDKLKGAYFKHLASFIVAKTQVAIAEKRSNELGGAIIETESVICSKTLAMKSLQSKCRRDQQLAQYRSVLGKTFFPKERRKTLTGAWTGWKTFFLWHRGHREAFELKYAQLRNAQKTRAIGSYIERKENVPPI